MKKIKGVQRTLSKYELAEKTRLADEHKPSNTITKSIKIANGWYKFYQVKADPRK